jgi:hypothetical protein
MLRERIGGEKPAHNGQDIFIRGRCVDFGFDAKIPTGWVIEAVRFVACARTCELVGFLLP